MTSLFPDGRPVDEWLDDDDREVVREDAGTERYQQVPERTGSLIHAVRQAEVIAPDERSITKFMPYVCISPEARNALVELVEAAHNAAILTYNPKATTAENDELQRRAARLRKAFERLGMDHAS